MVLIISTLCAAVFIAVVLARRLRDRREMERHGITPEALHALLASSQEVLVIASSFRHGILANQTPQGRPRRMEDEWLPSRAVHESLSSQFR